MPTPNVDSYLLQEKFGDACRFSTYRDALKVFAEKFKDTEWTVGGELIRFLSDKPDDICREILWVEPEFEGDPKEKSALMYPFAPCYGQQKEVVELHEPMLRDPKAWMETTASWLTLSNVMNHVRANCAHKPHVFLVFLDDAVRITFRNWLWHTNALSAHIYVPESDAYYDIHDANGNSSKKLQEIISLEDKKFSEFYGWLATTAKEKFPSLALYAGFEMGQHASQKPVRLWAAFTKDVNPHTLVTVACFYDKFQARFSPVIRRSVIGSLDLFWEATKGIDPHEDAVLPHFRAFIQWENGNDEWPFSLPVETVKEALKTICGIHASVTEDYGRPPSILGGLFLILGAISSKRGPCSGWLTKVVVSDNLKDGKLDSEILPIQTKVLAKEAVKCFFDLIMLICEHKNPPNPGESFIIRELHACAEYLEVHVAIDAFVSTEHPQCPLSKSIGYELTRLVAIKRSEKLLEASVSQPPTGGDAGALPPEENISIALTDPPYHAGEVAKAIARFALLGGIRINKLDSNYEGEVLFPANSFQVFGKTVNGEKRTILRLSKCKKSC